MPDDHGAMNTILEFALLGVTIFFAIWGVPISNSSRFLVDEADSIIVPAFAIMYFDYKGMIPLGKKTRQKIWFWFTTGLFAVIALGTFLMTAGTWQVAQVGGYQVITYDDMVSLTFSVMGILMIVYIIHMIRNREQYMKKRETA